MTSVMNKEWELSSSYEIQNHEMRTHVAEMLHQWGGAGSNNWPAKATVGRLETPPMSASWFYQIASLGKYGITRTIEGQHLPGTNWARGASYDVYFCPIFRGSNINQLGNELGCYIVDWKNSQIVYCHLGCTHEGAVAEKTGQLTKHSCFVCGARWEVDTSD